MCLWVHPGQFCATCKLIAIRRFATSSPHCLSAPEPPTQPGARLEPPACRTGNRMLVQPLLNLLALVGQVLRDWSLGRCTCSPLPQQYYLFAVAPIFLPSFCACILNVGKELRAPCSVIQVKHPPGYLVPPLGQPASAPTPAPAWRKGGTTVSSG